jgi:hypothetical protein
LQGISLDSAPRWRFRCPKTSAAPIAYGANSLRIRAGNFYDVAGNSIRLSGNFAAGSGILLCPSIILVFNVKARRACGSRSPELVDANDRRSGLYDGKVGRVGAPPGCTELTDRWGRRVRIPFLHGGKADPRVRPCPLSYGSVTTRINFV